jgi:hypothetical protein
MLAAVVLDAKQTLPSIDEGTCYRSMKFLEHIAAQSYTARTKLGVGWMDHRMKSACGYHTGQVQECFSGYTLTFS